MPTETISLPVSSLGDVPHYIVLDGDAPLGGHMATSGETLGELLDCMIFRMESDPDPDASDKWRIHVLRLNKVVTHDGSERYVAIIRVSPAPTHA